MKKASRTKPRRPQHARARRDVHHHLRPARSSRSTAPQDVAGLDYARDLGDPGQFPYTRGVHETMYRGKLWTMRQFAGFGSAAPDQRALQVPARARQSTASRWPSTCPR